MIIPIRNKSVSAAEEVIPKASPAARNHPRIPYPSPRGDRPSSVTGVEIDHEYVIYRLEEAGATLLALRGTGWSSRMRTSSIDIVRTALEAYGWDSTRIRPAVPSGENIDRMDEALGWLQFIPPEHYVLRRIVGARSLVHPVSDRHLYSWRRLGGVMGADHKAVQRWYGRGIAMITAALRQNS